MKYEECDVVGYEFMSLHEQVDEGFVAVSSKRKLESVMHMTTVKHLQGVTENGGLFKVKLEFTNDYFELPASWSSTVNLIKKVCNPSGNFQILKPIFKLRPRKTIHREPLPLP